MPSNVIRSATMPSPDDTAFVATDVGKHRVVVWISPVEGVPQVIGIDFMQRSDPAASPHALSVRMKEMAERFRKNPPAPLPRATLRDLRYSAMLEIHRQDRSLLASSPRRVKWTAASIGIAREEMKLIEPLSDAIVYLDACRNGDPKPSKALARERVISERTAQGRVARARKLGLLTRVKPGSRGGELTRKALDLKARLDEYTALKRSAEENSNG